MEAGNKSIEWVVFDLGGVLLTHDRKWAYQRLAGYLDKSFGDVSSFMEDDSSIYKQLSDKPVTPAELNELTGQRYGKSLSVDQTLAVMNAELGMPIESTVEIVKKLSKTYKVACLSNTNSLHWTWLKENCSFMKLFQVQMASQELGCSKPDVQIYHMAAQILGAAPNKCLFFDDRPENVEGARAAGWHAEHYISENRLMMDLELYGIKL